MNEDQLRQIVTKTLDANPGVLFNIWELALQTNHCQCLHNHQQRTPIGASAPIVGKCQQIRSVCAAEQCRQEALNCLATHPLR